MISLISSALPAPTKDDVISLQSPYAHSTLEHSRAKHRRPLSEILPDTCPPAVDLVRQLMRWSPDRRVSAREAIQHAYVTRFCDGEELTDIGSDVIPDITGILVILFNFCSNNLVILIIGLLVD